MFFKRKGIIEYSKKISNYGGEKMIICPHCNLMDLPDNTEICPKCHQRIIVARCKDCNRQLFGSETKRCPECKRAHHEKMKKILIAAGVVVFVAAGGYTILPLDVIPDAIPVAGFLDDIAVLTTGSTLGIAALISGFANGSMAKKVEGTQYNPGANANPNPNPGQEVVKPEPETVNTQSDAE